MLLEWNNGNVIIPRRVTEDDKFTFEGDVRETGDYFNRIADHSCMKNRGHQKTKGIFSAIH